MIEELIALWAELLGPADAELGDLVRNGYGIEPVDFYQEALRLVRSGSPPWVTRPSWPAEPPRVRVCILTDYYYPQLGGITEHVHGQATNLAALGHEVTILTGRIPHAPRAADRDERILAADDVEVVHMGLALPLYGNGSQTLHTVFPLGTRQLRRFLAERRFDVVHIHAPYNPSFFMLAPFVLPAGAVGVGTCHSVFTPGRVRDLVHAPTRASLSRLHGHVVVSESCIPPLDHYFPEFDWRVIPNGIDADHFAPSAEPIEELRASGDPVILFLGRFDPRNGLGIMLDSFSELWRRRGGERPALRRGGRPAAALLPDATRPRCGTSRALGGAHRLEPPALLRVGRRLLHTLPACELRHGAARGDELRAARGRQPHPRIRDARPGGPRGIARRAAGRPGGLRRRVGAHARSPG